jgi:hypothetical protein
MKITPNILSIPPHISTTWNNVSSLHTEETQTGYHLHITLTDGSKTTIPHLPKEVVDAALAAHVQYYDMENEDHKNKTPNSPAAISNAFSLKLGMSGLESLNSVLQHNQNDYASPHLPEDVLQKISQLSNLMSSEEINGIPQPEPHCNCPHCQITRAIHSGADSNKCPGSSPFQEECPEEIVSDEELRFRTWDINQQSNQLYSVTNPLDPQEHYHVFLGSPIGCTCGAKNCEHIKAVLSS